MEGTEAGGSNTCLELLTLNWGGNSEVSHQAKLGNIKHFSLQPSSLTPSPGFALQCGHVATSSGFELRWASPGYTLFQRGERRDNGAGESAHFWDISTG